MIRQYPKIEIIIDWIKSIIASSKYLLALFSPLFKVSIDQCSSDFEMYSLVLLGKTELEKAIMPPTKKASPVSRNRTLEKYVGNNAPWLVKANKTKIKKLIPQIITFSFISHFKSNSPFNVFITFQLDAKLALCFVTFESICISK